MRDLTTNTPGGTNTARIFVACYRQSREAGPEAMQTRSASRGVRLACETGLAYNTLQWTHDRGTPRRSQPGNTGGGTPQARACR